MAPGWEKWQREWDLPPTRLANLRNLPCPKEAIFAHRQIRIPCRRLQEKNMPRKCPGHLGRICWDEEVWVHSALPAPPSFPSFPPPPGRVQDLREECIKLKKRVFDLERQNQMLSALFQQKLQLTTGSLPQVSTCTYFSCPLLVCFLLPQVISAIFAHIHTEKQAIIHPPSCWGL